MKDKKLSHLLEIFLTTQIAKELPRQGFLYSGFKRNEADSVAAHSFTVTVFSYLFASELKESGVKIDPERTLKVALVHDLGETITGDIGTYAKDLARDVFDKVENEAFALLIRNMHNKGQLMEYFEEYQKLESLESQVVKFADALDAFVQGFNTPSADQSDLDETVNYIIKKKIKDPSLTKYFRKAVNLITSRKVSVYKGHIEKDEEQKKL